MDETFLTQQRQNRSTFEKKYLERIGNTGDKRIGLPGLSPQLVDKQREMEATNKQLEEARNKFEQWKTNFQSKRQEIEKKQQALAEQKKDLDNFSQHQNQELEKAKTRRKDEIKEANEIEIQLRQLSETEEQKRALNEKLKAELEELQPCADYLQSVVESCTSFDNIDAILHRYETLSETRSIYLAQYQELMSTYGNDEIRLQHELEFHKSKLIDSTMKYNEAIAKINQIKKKHEYNKTSLIKEVQRVDDKKTELAAIKTSIKTIYNRALNKSSATVDQIQKKKGDVDEEAMLEYIKNRFKDLKDIISEHMKLENQNTHGNSITQSQSQFQSMRSLSASGSKAGNKQKRAVANSSLS